MAWSPGWNILPMLSGATLAEPHAIAADGTTVVGTIATDPGNVVHGVVWTSAGISDLGLLAPGVSNEAWACSADGSVITGDNGIYAYRWTSGGGLVAIHPTGGDTNTPRSISDDGAVIGFADNLLGAAIWTSGGVTALQAADAFSLVDAPSLSPSGLWAAGIRGFHLDMFVWNGAPDITDIAFDYTGIGLSMAAPVIDDDGAAWICFRTFATGAASLQQIAPTFPAPIVLGLLPGGSYSFGQAVTPDGAIVAGNADASSGAETLFVWTAGAGMVALDVTPAGYDTLVISGISRDGSVITGQISDVDGLRHGFVFYAPSTPPIPPDFPLDGVFKVLLPSAELQFADADGRPYAGGTLDTFVVGTTTPKTTWRDSAGVAENENPIVLDSAGRCIIFGNGGYRTVLKDSDGNTIWDQPSYTYVSVAMLPVVGAATLEDAREAMGITDAIEAEATARAAADSAEATARADADAAEATARAAADAAEAAARAAGDAALQAEIDALPPALVSNVQGSWGQVDGSGHVRITFPLAFTTLKSVVASYKGVGFGSNTLVIGNEDRFGFDLWITEAGTPIPKPNELFYWLALGT